MRILAPLVGTARPPVCLLPLIAPCVLQAYTVAARLLQVHRDCAKQATFASSGRLLLLRSMELPAMLALQATSVPRDPVRRLHALQAPFPTLRG
jgi:hypothetical protein